mmetsp:Transcript_5411/g.8162  ORF Transcript_5411/g.8162 Transcript_5411/m.8162 type:complete len:167 (-) Transcript_5411:116-616(-)|eukprot:CAMPEP_0201506578 /NCGR_PEP_ID=MMETSP0161_2-20130828/491_1 /ASSEMBLY_ACC=CAM_ASM_000251 /TAXON_ID=180227 /ORGANISM="Neoparamoeba aestuarina, Strain SoJaBio B1-5/56/2" /LENGTH=166 /DNA_ID=CAMNT_0047900713 /DNA_START=45 /DNA_END=545 /DNA_ORIENTATION=+
MKLSVVLVILAAVAYTQAFETCTYKASDGSFYDLHLIRSHHQGLRNVAEDSQGMKYYWNLCESIVDARFHTDFENPCPDHAFVCQQTSSLATKDCGGSPREIFDGEAGPNQGVTIVVSGGDEGCNDLQRKTTINVNCGSDTDPVITEIGPCHYNIRYDNRLACPRI